MKKAILKINILLVIALFYSLFACSGNGGNSQVKIGEQVWMTKNLSVPSFKNGDPIPEAKTFEDWKKANKDKTPIYCYPEFNPAKEPNDGKFYNFYAVTDPRGLAPEGWRIPSRDDWEMLKLSVIRSYEAEGIATQLKAKKVWDSINGGLNVPATNRTKFNAYPSGYIHVEEPNEYGTMIGSDGFASEIKNYAIASWWVVGGESSASILHNSDIGYSGTPRNEGHAVRCIKN